MNWKWPSNKENGLAPWYIILWRIIPTLIMILGCSIWSIGVFLRNFEYKQCKEVWGL